MVLSLIASQITFAQEDEGDIYFQIGVEDAERYIEEYLRPFYNGVGYGFTGGWYNTAETHKQWGFDFTISMNVAYIPRRDTKFLFENEDYDKLSVRGGSAQLATIFGPQNKQERPELSIVNSDDDELVIVTSPPGAINMKSMIGFNAVPIPMYQVGLGLIKHTDIKLRILPKIDFGDGSVGMFGLGFQHDIAQWFKVMRWQHISLAVMGGFNNLTLRYDLNYDEPVTAGNEVVFKLSGINIQAIASKEYYNVITIYGGLGYSRAGSQTQVLGVYPAEEVNYQLPDNPIDLQYGNNSLNTTLGLTLKFLFVTVGVSHTIQKYHVTTVSTGISIR